LANIICPGGSFKLLKMEKWDPTKTVEIAYKHLYAYNFNREK